MNKSVFKIFFIFLKLGLTSFGGPVAHLGFFHNEFVKKRAWLSEHAYADLVGLCQFLPGPASSQVGMGLGFSRAGFAGALAAWLGFTLPSAVIMTIMGLGISNLGENVPLGALHGLKIAATAVVAQAILLMSLSLCPDYKRKVFAFFATVFAVYFKQAQFQIIIILFFAALSIYTLKNIKTPPHPPISVFASKKMAIIFLVTFFLILTTILIIKVNPTDTYLYLFNEFFRAGSLVFGGGHVVLPLLKTSFVDSSLITNNIFLAGYGAAQSIPGPLFTFSSYLGAHIKGLIGALICLFAVFLPSFLLILGVLPFWEKIRSFRAITNALAGANAAVVGLLLAVFINSIWSESILNWKDFMIFLITTILLVKNKIPSWFSAVACSLIGYWLL